MAKKGSVIVAGRTLNADNSAFGLIIFNAESEEAAWQIVHDDPSVKNKVARAELYPMGVALFNPNNLDSRN